MQAPTKATEIGLVLQGGGALGAYEYGAITALLELIDEAAGKGRAVSLKAVTGVSIGAINAACVVGAATRTDARRRLASLWNDLVLETPVFWPRQARRDLALYGLPNFYSLRADVLSFSTWTHVYDTHSGGYQGVTRPNVKLTPKPWPACLFVLTTLSLPINR